MSSPVRYDLIIYLYSLEAKSYAEFSEGTRILRASSYGTSLWTRTARVTTILPDGEKKDYFLKVQSLKSQEACCTYKVNSVPPREVPS
jgi:hypothetical protein